MGLIHPTDLTAWEEWQARRHKWRGALARLHGAAEATGLVLTLGGPQATVLVALDSRASSSVAAYVTPLRHIESSRLAVLAGEPRTDLLGDSATVHAVSTTAELALRMPQLEAVLSAGNYLPAGATAHDAVLRAGGRSYVAQHGLLTPHAPPLPSGCTLIAWSSADAEFWRSGRDDVSVEVSGSQLLWDASLCEPVSVEPGVAPTFLGQLHGAELPRREMARVSYTFCRDNRATYRPHPSEVDKLSRLQHALWRRRGVAFDASGLALADLATPVVGVFSTGLLEAAAAGKPAWAYHPDPPAWVRDLWVRYDMGVWGGAPTPTPEQPDTEPAVQVARLLAG